MLFNCEECSETSQFGKMLDFCLELHFCDLNEYFCFQSKNALILIALDD